MKLWMSGEIMADVSESYRDSRKIIEQKVNDFMSKEIILPEVDEWAYIAIIRDEDHPDYKEVYKRSSKGKVLEFRLKISHEKFLTGSKTDCIFLILDSLDRSIDLMSSLGVTEENQVKLKKILHSVKDDLLKYQLH